MSEEGEYKFTYTSHLRFLHKQEIESLQKYTYTSQIPRKKTSQISDMKQSSTHQIKLNKISSPPENETRQICKPINQNAIIVKGKLIYFQPDTQSKKVKGKQLLSLLRSNNIRYKDYILGTKQKYLAKIEQNIRKNEEQTIENLINQHINMQKTTKIQSAIDCYSQKQS